MMQYDASPIDKKRASGFEPPTSSLGTDPRATLNLARTTTNAFSQKGLRTDSGLVAGLISGCFQPRSDATLTQLGEQRPSM